LGAAEVFRPDFTEEIIVFIGLITVH
jgi:hypothetical protein